jgi:hypothetical protein
MTVDERRLWAAVPRGARSRPTLRDSEAVAADVVAREPGRWTVVLVDLDEETMAGLRRIIVADQARGEDQGCC